jgi:hypothetical protein
MTLLAFLSCKKETFITGPEARISISADTLHFDTVFTQVGSVTQAFKIHNDNNQKLRISRISLKGGSASAFKINADGVPGPEVHDLDLEANDSLYVFVSVTIRPGSAQLPFLVQDSIEVDYNGTGKWVQLEAYGQNAHFLRNQVLEGNTTWTNDLPYVIIGPLFVDTTASLHILQGCRIYLHANAPLIVDGSLTVQGNHFDSTRVYFRGDRLDDPYNGFPAAWPGIYFRGSSHDNLLQYAVIQNAYQGLVALQPQPGANPKLTLNECILDNIYDIGLYGIQSSISARNCLISNCGKNVALVYGGNYQFTHCTLVDSSNYYVSHKDPALTISNNIQQGGSTLASDLNVTFSNSIIWGSSDSGSNRLVPEELVVSKSGSGTFQVNFDHCLWKMGTVPAGIHTQSMIVNQYPLFDSINTDKRYYSFRLKAGSPALEKAAPGTLNLDLDGNPRPVGLPDIGCYEKQ